MATPTHTRTALSEIPGRMEALRVATTPTTTRTPNEPTPANVLNPTAPDAFMNVSFHDNSSLIPSPDEIVIRQRGRRRFTLSWSPEKCPNRSPFQKTPTKTPTTQMTLRSSPRKRLLVNDSQYPNSPDKCNNNNVGILSPRKAALVANAKLCWTGTPVVKKLKLEEKPIAQTSTGTPLQILLKGLSQDQLIGIIQNIADNDDKLDGKIRTELPMPDIGPLEEELVHMKRNIFKSLPTSRLCKKNDSIAYTRAVTHLSAFKRIIVNQSRILHDSTHWDALLDYVCMAWNYVRGTPVWESASHNTIRRQCFKVLSCHCVAALKFGGLRLGPQRLQNMERHLKEWSKDYEDVLSCVSMLNKVLLKYRTSL